MNTCQRIILAAPVANEILLDNLQNDFYAELGITEVIGNEKFFGSNAIRHLSEVISSLDSITLGEDQIHNQFKLAFAYCQPHMGNLLNFLMQRIIRLGKRIRQLSVFQEGKVSTISMVVKYYSQEIINAKSIGIVGTGKMSKGIVKVLKNYNDNLSIYTRNSARKGEDLDHLQIKSFSAIEPHNILILVTDSPTPILNRDLLESKGYTPRIVFDLSLPRNSCDDVVSEKTKLLTLSDLLEQSKNSVERDVISDIYDKMNEEIRQIIHEYIKFTKSKIFKSLRTDIQELAEQSKSNIIECETTTEQKQREYQLLINKMLHISQGHIEELIKGGL